MSYMTTFNLPENTDTEKISISSVYGFAYYSGHTEHWRYYIGSFPYLYGIFTARYNMDLHVMEEMTLVKVPVAYTFMYINQDYEPFKLINKVKPDPATSSSIGQNNKVYLTDLSVPNDHVPTMKFVF